MYPLSWGFFYCTRSLLQFSEWFGIMDKEKGLGGQILGYNFYRHPVWVHWVVDGLAAAATNGVVVCLVLLSARKVFRSGRPTLCGACGADIERAGGLVIDGEGCKCPACRVSTSQFDTRKSSFYMFRRLCVLVVVLGIAHAIVNKAFVWDLRSFFLWICESCGGEVTRLSGRMATGSNGPFYADGIMPVVYNYVYTYGPIFTIEIASALGGLFAYWVTASPLGRTRMFGYRGPTLCGGCGYQIASLKSARCPECGKSLQSTSTQDYKVI